MLVAAGVQDDDVLWYQEGSQRDVLGDDQIACLSVIDDVLVSYIRPTVDPDGGDVRIANWRLQPLVRHEHGRNAESFGGPEDDVLDVAWCSVRVNPDFQGWFLTSEVGPVGRAECARCEPAPLKVATVFRRTCRMDGAAGVPEEKSEPARLRVMQGRLR